MRFIFMQTCKTRGDVAHQTRAVYLRAGDEYQICSDGEDPPRCHTARCRSGGAASFSPANSLHFKPFQITSH